MMEENKKHHKSSQQDLLRVFSEEGAYLEWEQLDLPWGLPINPVGWRESRNKRMNDIAC